MTDDDVFVLLYVSRFWLFERLACYEVVKTHEPYVCCQPVKVTAQVHVETGTNLRTKKECKRHPFRCKLSAWNCKTILNNQGMLLHLPDCVFLHQVFCNL